MIDPIAAKKVIEQYNKHGWTLRRVLFSSPLSDPMIEIIQGAPSRSSVIDAFWFSRRSQPGREAWELRRLSGSPFALVQVIEDRTEEAAFEDLLVAVEHRMSAASGPISH